MYHEGGAQCPFVFQDAIRATVPASIGVGGLSIYTVYKPWPFLTRNYFSKKHHSSLRIAWSPEGGKTNRNINKRHLAASPLSLLSHKPGWTPRRRITARSSLKKYPRISWEIGCSASPQPFLQQASWHIFKDDVDGFSFFFFYLTILQPDITGYRGRKKSTFYIIFSQFFNYTKK